MALSLWIMVKIELVKKSTTTTTVSVVLSEQTMDFLNRSLVLLEDFLVDLVHFLKYVHSMKIKWLQLILFELISLYS